MSFRVGNGPTGTRPASTDADRARVFTSLVMAESRTGQRSVAAAPWSGVLNGKPISATPVGPRAASGNQMWRVTWSPDGKAQVSVEASIREQFGPQHVQPGTPVRRALDAQLTANQSGPKAWSSPDGFMGKPVEAKPIRRVPGTDKYVWEVSVMHGQAQIGTPNANAGRALAAMAKKPVVATFVAEGAFDPAVLQSDTPLTRDLKAKLGAA